jgi:hypothetical protein
VARLTLADFASQEADCGEDRLDDSHTENTEGNAANRGFDQMLKLRTYERLRPKHD